MTKKTRLLVLVVALAVLPSLVYATAIVGNIAINGSSWATGGSGVRVGNTATDSYVDFYLLSPPAPPAPGSTGGFDVGTASGYFSGLTGNQQPLYDLVQSRQPAGVWGAPYISIPNYFTFTSSPGLNFNLEYTVPCSGPLYGGSGSGCAPGTFGQPSPFSITDTASGALFSFGLRGEVSNGSDYGTWTALISGTFVGFTGTQVLNTLASQGWVETSWSGTIDAVAIPEPATALLTGGALLALAGLLKKFRR